MIGFAIHSPCWPKDDVAPAVSDASAGALLQHLELVLVVDAVAGALSRRWQAGKWSPRGSGRAR